MRRLRNTAAIGVFVACLLAPVTSAQTPDSAAFHGGQWGVDFRIGNGFAGVGALHFKSPTRALLVDLNGSYDHNSSTALTSLHLSEVNATLSLGTRGYRHIGAHIYRWTTLGISLAYNRQAATQAGITQKAEAIGGGLFVNLGGPGS